ncbi:MAG: hypothetical protein ACKVS6_07780 [Planctomycetota bacterium]
MTSDLLHRWTSSFRGTPPPAPRADLRVDILQLYEAEFIKQDITKENTTKPEYAAPVRRRSSLKWMMTGAAAAALGSFILFATQQKNPAVPVAVVPPVVKIENAAAPDDIASIEARRVILISRAEAIKKALAESKAPRVVARAAPRVIIKDTKSVRDPKLQEMERTIQSVATHTSEPVEHVYRLVAARLFENVDKQSAIKRYQELIRDYPDGAACGVANQRLQTLLQ